MAIYASVAGDVVPLFRTLTADETVKADRLMEFASAMLRQQVGQLDERLAAGTLDPEVVAAVATAMVVRVLRNPEGRRQESQTVGPFSESWTVDNALSTGALYLSPEELAQLAPPAAMPFVGSIRLGSAWL